MLTDTYEAQTTFWMDFTIADRFGRRAIIDTYNRAFEGWKSNVVYVTELSIVLNHKIWQHWQAGRKAIAEVYDKLWRTVDDWCKDNLEGEDLSYYYQITD